jgi:23S rRNA (cytosine1962-C5)-methyltransferase
MTLPTIKLKPQRAERHQHPWVFDNEIVSGPGEDFVDGSLVRVLNSKGRALGVGFLNRNSRIAFRYLTRATEETIDAKFWAQLVVKAYQYRQQRYKSAGGLPVFYRLIHGESDGMPGLVADVYGKYIVVQILALGLEPWRKALIEAIVETIPGIDGIYERSDSSVRLLEGLEPSAGVLWGSEPPDELEFQDGGVTVLVDVKSGAKTGLFLDQRENQAAAAKEASDKEVLNCFSYTGLFGLRAASAGAKSVIEVESSAEFNAINIRQWQRNGFDLPHKVETANVFDYLRELARQDFRTDLVILDPPAFAKSRATLDAAVRGYNEINRMALKLLRPGGVLVTCSCSHHLRPDEFRAIVQMAALDARREVKLIEQRGQPPDHPVLMSAPESEYLKCLILAVY